MKRAIIAGATFVLLGYVVPAAAVQLVAAQDAQPAAIEVRYGDNVYDVEPADGPVIVCVDSITTTEDGATVAGVVIARDSNGFYGADPFVDPSPSRLARAVPGDCFKLDVPGAATLGDATTE